MGRNLALALYGLVMVVTVVASDVWLFRSHFWARLLFNVGTVMVFGAFYVRFRSSFGSF